MALELEEVERVQKVKQDITKIPRLRNRLIHKQLDRHIIHKTRYITQDKNVST